MDYEIAAINISINNQTVTVLEDEKVKSNEDDLPAFAWHRDSYPFVCVTMLSDCTGMVGGETALKTASGEIMKVRGPSMVSLKPITLYLIKRLSKHTDEDRGLLSSCKVDTLNTRHLRLSVGESVSA